MIPLIRPVLLDDRDERAAKEQVRRVNVESNLWRYGKFTMTWTGSLGANTSVDVPVHFSTVDYIKADMAMTVSCQASSTALALPHGIGIVLTGTVGDGSGGGYILFRVTNTTGTPVVMTGTYTMIYDGVIVNDAGQKGGPVQSEASVTVTGD